jgi:protein-tyrosine phosphatase
MKILMVCLGNICRSPLAAGLLREKLSMCNIDGTVDSAGFEPYHNGDTADDRAQQVAKKHGIDLSTHRARLFRKSDFDTYDKIYVMDDGNYRDVLYMARNEEDKKKVDYIMNEVDPGKNLHVPDPYYGGLFQFEEVFQLLDQACTKIIARYIVTE